MGGVIFVVLGEIMSDADAGATDLFEHIHQLEKQVEFLVVVWNKRDENYPTIARGRVE